jgi:hypothetical protein
MATPASAAAVLPLADHAQFFQAVAAELAGREIGDGLVHRAVTVAFHAVFVPPDGKTASWDIEQELPKLCRSKLANGPPIEYGGDLRHVRYRNR